MAIASLIPLNVIAGTSTNPPRIPAIKLITTPDSHSAYLKGSIPVLEKIPAQNFWINNSVEAWEKSTHPAPRKQYVITLKGKLKFKVSDGSTFILSPGTVLLAEDTNGEGHRWELMEGDEWVRVYIPMTGDNDYFVADQ
ncbi:hypothetical protein O0537_13360 [Dickeya solani]|uniref:Cupin 2 conserved barrel domain-containing protein n=2 Tax=Dickeya solani TaxID=1089444 RepID=A0ABU4EC44_9GAMM|nr:hypothetical protein [Dickeya solani]MCA6998798.1 hypothetical protein [Dickeya solani]MCZ0822248.1 hypothetical protein [Dickeya solani]MDV6994653.1 hypothetical protein [Dickeya solani]MDV7004032.1 hypothetical protein [Dickeya solani]MDV7039797.1 hypothetical protein [Dickeya solani]